MILYRVESESEAPFLVPTQFEAKRQARELRGTWSQENVPNDKEGLRVYLNDLLRRQFILTDPMPAVVELPTEPVKQAAPTTPAVSPSSITLTAIEEFILNVASVAQVEQVFARLGTRFKELANAR